GVGKTSLVYHVSWMLSELGHRTLAVDLDPQANLTSAFLKEEALVELWEAPPTAATTMFRCVAPLLGVGDVRPPQLTAITENLALLPGDLALAGFEDELAAQWPAALGERNLYRPFRVLTSFWQASQAAARETGAEVVLV